MLPYHCAHAYQQCDLDKSWCHTPRSNAILSDCAVYLSPQVDMLFIQTLNGIRDIHKSGIKEEDFSEVIDRWNYVYSVWAD